MGAVSPLSSAKTSLNTNKEERVVNANMRMEEKGNGDFKIRNSISQKTAQKCIQARLRWFAKGGLINPSICSDIRLILTL